MHKDKGDNSKLMFRMTVVSIFLAVLLVAGVFISGQVEAAWANDPALNNPISTSTNYEFLPTIASDGRGGAIITWTGTDFTQNAIYAQRIDSRGVVQWSANGVLISIQASNPVIVSDDSGGAIIAWSDSRNGTSSDIYAQRIDSSGVVQWSADGVLISTAGDDQSLPRSFPIIVSDGSGGAIIAWTDLRNGIIPVTYAQRIDSSGVVQWTANGVLISTVVGDQVYLTMASDGRGGAIIAWQNLINATGWGIYAQRIASNGVLQWTADGVAVSTAAGDQVHPNIASDGRGGAIITWLDDHSSPRTIRAQRINAGGAAKWAAAGVLISKGACEESWPSIASDDRAGAIITWSDDNFYIFAQRINARGVLQWSADGAAISERGSYGSPIIVSDGKRGAIITWSDYNDIYAQRVNARGVLQWSADGAAISTAEDNQYFPAIVSDCRGGAIITWWDFRTSSATSSDIYAQRIYANGSSPFTEVTMLTPNGGESIATGSTYRITWSAPAEAVKFTIQYSTDNGSTWNTIASNVKGTNYNVTVPKVTANMTQCRVQVTGYNASGLLVGSDVSDGPFTIEVVRVTSPNGGETWKSGSAHANQKGCFVTARPDSWIPTRRFIW